LPSISVLTTAMPHCASVGIRGDRLDRSARTRRPCAGTIATINRIVNEFLASDEGKRTLLNFGMEPLGGTPEDLAGFMASELVKCRPVAEKLTPE
jgi:hypothetical protein